MSSHYRCRYLFSLLPVLLSWSSIYRQPHRSNQRIESSSASLCIFRIHLNCFQRSLVRSEKGRWARPTVTSVNRQQTKYQINNQKDNKYFTWWLAWKWPSLVPSQGIKRDRTTEQADPFLAVVTVVTFLLLSFQCPVPVLLFFMSIFRCYRVVNSYTVLYLSCRCLVLILLSSHFCFYR